MIQGNHWRHVWSRVRHSGRLFWEMSLWLIDRLIVTDVADMFHLGHPKSKTVDDQRWGANTVASGNFTSPHRFISNSSFN